MPLFQQSVVNKYINNINKAELQTAWQAFTSHFHNAAMQQNIRNLKEEEYQEGFVRDLFVTVMGYTLNPQPGYNLVLEKKSVTDATKSDGAVLLDDKVTAVIELKDTGTTDLDKVSNQAFGYKHKHKNCIYVITANFEKLRFYINDATGFEEFNLFTISHERFALLYLCLQRDNLLAHLPLQVKQQSIASEENVTKQLYADYSAFKRKLFQNIAAQNLQYDKLLLFKKTQKLLDRFLFIFFAEDRLLLPPNSVREILQQWEDLKTKYDEYFPLYSRFKKYFGYLNTGHTGRQHEIFAYNGGLFLPDEVLENLVIDDTILFEGAKALGNYDFETDVDVNILGHIFEHSLTETEAIEQQFSSPEDGRAVTSKRKKDGVFYTPCYITRYIVENTVGALCIQQKEKMQINEETFAPQKRKDKRKQLLDKIDAYREWLLQLTICDPACGSGAFLNAALEYLKAEHRAIDELKATLFGDAIVYTDIDNCILENNLYGVDINEEAAEIAKLSLWLHTAKKGRKLSNLNSNIKCGNSLIEDTAIAGDKAFVWEEQFKTVFEKGGFDVVIGNPPYVSSKKEMHKESFKEYWLKSYHTAVYQIDTYLLFIELGKRILKDSGILSLIIPNAWLNNVFMAPVRKFILENMSIDSIIKTPSNTFLDASVDTVIVILKEYHQQNLICFKYLEIEQCIEEGRKSQKAYLQDSSHLLVYRKNDSYDLIIEKMETECLFLEKVLSIARGVGIYHKRVGHTKDFIKQDPFFSFNKNDETFVPYLRGKNIGRYDIEWNEDSFISYGKWLAEPREPKYFEGERILLRQIPGNRNLYCTFLDKSFIIDQSVFIGRNEDLKFSSLYLTAILSSRLMAFYFRNKYSEFDDLFPKVKLQHFKDFPIKDLDTQSQQLFAMKADTMLSKNKELHKFSHQFIQLLRAKFLSIRINKKLENWYTLSGNEFLKELTRQKIKLPLAEQQEWLQYFEDQKAKANAIRDVITQTDAAIDQMVYALYGLSDEEIKMVEGKSQNVTPSGF